VSEPSTITSLNDIWRSLSNSVRKKKKKLLSESDTEMGGPRRGQSRGRGGRGKKPKGAQMSSHGSAIPYRDTGMNRSASFPQCVSGGGFEENPYASYVAARINSQKDAGQKGGGGRNRNGARSKPHRPDLRADARVRRLERERNERMRYERMGPHPIGRTILRYPPGFDVSRLIGPYGNVHAIRQATGAIIDVFGDVGEVVITGHEKAVFEAQARLLATINEPPRDPTVTFAFDPIDLHKLIGPGGSTIKRLNAETGARIVVPKSRGKGGPKGSCLCIVTAFSQAVVNFACDKVREALSGPTHIIALRVKNPEVKERLKAIQDEIIAKEPDLEPVVCPVDKLHVPLGVIYIDPEDMGQYLASVRTQATRAVGAPPMPGGWQNRTRTLVSSLREIAKAQAAIPCQFSKLGHFTKDRKASNYSQVLFAKPESAGLGTVAAEVRTALAAQQFSEQSGEFIPHATIMQTVGSRWGTSGYCKAWKQGVCVNGNSCPLKHDTPRAGRKLRGIHMSLWETINKSGVDLGGCTFDEIELLAIRGDDGKGYYPAVCRFPLSGGSRGFSSSCSSSGTGVGETSSSAIGGRSDGGGSSSGSDDSSGGQVGHSRAWGGWDGVPVHGIQDFVPRSKSVPDPGGGSQVQHSSSSGSDDGGNGSDGDGGSHQAWGGWAAMPAPVAVFPTRGSWGVR